MPKGNPHPQPYTGAKKPTVKQRAREMLLEGRTVAEVAAQCEVSDTTVYAWRRQPEFVRRMQSAQDSRLAIASDKLRAMLGEGLDVLREVMTDPHAPAVARVKAATEILDRAGLTSKQVVVVQPTTVALTNDSIDAARRYLDSLAAEGKPNG